MTHVFISGSRSITTLPTEAVTSLESIVAKQLTVLVGDCYGVDTLVQAWLKARSYHDVVVYHVGGQPRNNLAGWPTRAYHGPQSHKDKAMAADATCGLVIWDGKSPGSKNNIAALGRKYTKVIQP